MINPDRESPLSDIHKLVKRDGFISEIFRLAHPQFQDQNGIVRREIHTRGRKRVGIMEPNGGIIIFDSKDVVHDYDSKGAITNRFVMENPPEGYIVIAGKELDAINSDENTVSFGRIPRE